ncbi:MAG TPA: serine kinase [Thermodesulfobacteriota bacterium]|nr:serine kinase [Thermodesulfobacteriota bacterium]
MKNSSTGSFILLLSYFNEAFRVFLDAEQDTSAVDRFYTIANHTVRLRFVGQTLVDSLSPALEHLVAERVPEQSLTVCLWDGASTKKQIPSFPWDENVTMAKNIQSPNEGTNPVIYFYDERIRGAYQVGTDTLSMLDTKLNTAIFWVPDVFKISYYERSSPLRALFQWWANNHRLQLLHSGAIGIDTGGILLVGEGGSGKSTTALACLQSKLCYVSDDYCLVDRDSHPYAHSVYSSAKIDEKGLQRFPHLALAAENIERLAEEKALLFLNRHWPEKISRGFPVRALLVPRITGGEKTRLTPASPRDTLLAFAPSTMLQLRGATQEDLSFMARLNRHLPGYFLELGKNTDNVPDIILDLLSKNDNSVNAWA